MPPKRKAINAFKGVKPSNKPLKKNGNNATFIKEGGDTNKTGKTYIPKVKIESPSPALLDRSQENEHDNNAKTNKGYFFSFALNNILQQKVKSNYQGSICWKSFTFPSIIHFPTLPNNTQYFGLDLIEAESERTIWTHKPAIWKELFESVEEFDKTGQFEPISTMFHGVLSCPLRAIPKGPNDTQFFISSTGQKIQHWIMLIPMPADCVPFEYI